MSKSTALPDTHTILLVEDNELVMEMTRMLLECSGYRVVSTHLPTVALELIQQGDASVDLLLTDVVMPQMNGPELHQRIKEMLPGMPVLYMSGYSSSVLNTVMHSDGTSFLAKPFTSDQLLSQVRQVLAT